MYREFTPTKPPTLSTPFTVPLYLQFDTAILAVFTLVVVPINPPTLLPDNVTVPFVNCSPLISPFVTSQFVIFHTAVSHFPAIPPTFSLPITEIFVKLQSDISPLFNPANAPTFVWPVTFILFKVKL